MVHHLGALPDGGDAEAVVPYQSKNKDHLDV